MTKVIHVICHTMNLFLTFSELLKLTSSVCKCQKKTFEVCKSNLNFASKEICH